MSIAKFQQMIGATPDGDFGPKTLKAAADYFELENTEAAHFFGQCAHETGDFKTFTENLNYTAAGLMKIWPKHFQTMSVARAYAHDPEAIANRAYANRMGNGPATTGDGWKFRGRGAIQLTGRSTYAALATSSPHLAVVMDNPDVVADKFAFHAAIWYFSSRNIWTKTKTVDDAAIEAVTRLVNGGTHGLADRAAKTKRYFDWLKKETK